MTKAKPKAPAPIDMDALPPAGGSYTRWPDGTLALNQPEPEQPADPPADPPADTPPAPDTDTPAAPTAATPE